LKSLTVDFLSFITLLVSRFFEIIGSFQRSLISFTLILALLLTSAPPTVSSTIAPYNSVKQMQPLAVESGTDNVNKARALSATLPDSEMFALSPTTVTAEIAVVRRILNLNSGRIEGSVQQLDGENLSLDGSSVITQDLLVPGTPTVQTNGNPSFGGVVEGTGSAQPSNYTVAIKGNASLRHLVRRTDPISLLPIAAPPTPTGTRDVSLTQPGQSAGDFLTLRDLTLSGQAGTVAVPPGTYGRFTASGQTTFVLGVQGSNTPAIYNLQELTLNGSSTVRLAGPVIVTVANNVTLNGQSLMGEGTNPQWLLLKLATQTPANSPTPGLKISGNGTLHGLVLAPSTLVKIDGNSTLEGALYCDRLTLSGLLKVRTGNQSPLVNSGNDQTIGFGGTATLSGMATDDGLPNHTLITSWSKVSGPGVVTFANANTLTTTATFSAAGTYLLRLTANDTSLTNFDELTVTVTPQNQAPVVNAGTDLTLTMPHTAALNGNATDDGLPTGNSLSFQWSKVSGPGNVTFANAAQMATTASFSTTGVYVLRLTASDGVLSATDDVQISVHPANQAPVVNAGADQAITLPSSVTLSGTATDDGLPTGSTRSVTWSKISGAGDVTFANANAPSTTATFSAPGTYVLRLTVSDTELSAYDEVTITANPQNRAPTVLAGPFQSLTLPNAVTLSGTATDDGLPTGSTLFVTWSKVTGPGDVTFANATQAATTATFTVAGVYVLRLSATDGALTSSDEIQITVIPQNQAPVVNAGADQSITLPNAATLNATVSDDGLPQGSSLAITWSKVSGPGTVSFANPGAAQTTAGFSVAGTYVLRLSASDSALSATDEVTITVIADNQPPVVSAGSDQTITLPTNTVTLNGTATDDGKPQGSTLAIAWSKVNGPGTVTFASPTQAQSTATFSAAGAYTLRLSASDSLLTSSSDITVTVRPQNQAPQVTAGPNQTVTLPDSVALNGAVTDDGLPTGATLAISWSKFSGPGLVTFNNPNQAATTASFGPTGIYVLRLTASDGELSSSSDVTVTVNTSAPGVLSAAFTVPGTAHVVPMTIKSFSNASGAFTPSLLLDNNIFTYWQTQTGQVTNQFVELQISESGEPLIDRVRLQSRNGSVESVAVKNFDVLVSTTGNAADYVTVLSATCQNIGTLQEFIFPGGAVRARFVKLTVKDNYGANTIALGTFQTLTVGSIENVITLPAQNDVARNGSPSLLINGARVVSYSSHVSNKTPDNMLTTNDPFGWATDPGDHQFAIIELAGGLSYTINGVRIAAVNQLKDFEVWVSNTTTDATAFTRVLSATFATSPQLQTFLFPGGPEQARYVKYVPLAYSLSSTGTATSFFDVIAEGGQRVVEVSSVTGAGGIPDRAFDNISSTIWTSASLQSTNQYIKVLLAGAVIHKVYGVVLDAPAHVNTPKNFEVRVSTTTAEDSAFSIAFTGVMANLTGAQEFRFPAPVDAKYVQFFFKDNYGGVQIWISNLEVRAIPVAGSSLLSFTSQSSFSTQFAPTALDFDTTNGPWMSASGQTQNQALVLVLPGNDPWMIDQVAIQPGRNGADVTVGAKNFDLMASTTDAADSSFTTVFTGAMQNVQLIQQFSFPAVPARYLKLVVKDNYGSVTQTGLNSFFAITPQLGSTNARFIDRSSATAGSIVSYAWDFGDGGSSVQRDPVHTYAEPGVYFVKLTVTDNAGATSSSQLVYHAQAPLAADFSFTTSGQEATVPVQMFDQSPPQLAGAVRRWSFGDGLVNQPNGYRLYDDSGLYTVTLTIGDPNGINFRASKQVSVANLPPTIFTITARDLVLPGQEWTATANISDPSTIDQASLRCNWDFGDGQATEIYPCTVINSSVKHIFANPGLYDVMLSVFDKDGGIAGRTVRVSTTNKQPSAFTGFQANNSGQPGNLLMQARLIDEVSTAPLSGRSVTFAIGSSNATSITDASGNAQATLPFTAGSVAVIASVFFAGDSEYLASGAGIELLPGTAPPACAPSQGTDYWLMFPASATTGSTELRIAVSSGTTTTGAISIPGLNFNTTFTVQAGATTIVSLPYNASADVNNQVQSKGIHVTSQNPVTVHGFDMYVFSSDGFMALPTSSLGTQYLTMSYKGSPEFAIVAAHDQTTVTIIPTQSVLNRTARVPFTITLNQGQTYQLLGGNGSPPDTTGSVISADKPIAVYSGNQCTNVPDFEPACNHIIEQLLPVNSWPTDYAFLPFGGRSGGDQVKVLASADNTRVYVNGSLMITLNRGDFTQFLAKTPTHIVADHPILVSQFAASSGFDNTGGDPTMLNVTGATQFLDHYTFSTFPANAPTLTGVFTNYVDVVAPASAVGQITLDGTAIPASAYRAISDSGFYGAQMVVSAGTHRLAGPVTFGAAVYGFGFYDAYAYPAGLCIPPQTTSYRLSLAPLSASHPVGSQGCVTAVLTDLAGRPVSGFPVSFTAAGVSTASGIVTTDANGQARFCYSGATAGSDLITASAEGATATASKTWGSSPNIPPTVSAGTNKTLTLPTNTVTMTGTASDDGLPQGSALTLTWSQVSGPAGVTFANASNPVTTATFPTSGSYVLQLVANDTQFTNSATVMVTVNPTAINQPPVVGLGALQIIRLDDNLIKNPSAEDTLVAGKIDGWTAASGTWSQATGAAAGLPPAFNKTKFFSAAASSTAELYQDVDVTPWTATINAGSQQFEFEAWVRSANETPADSARIMIEFRDILNTHAFETLDTGATISTATWTLFTDRRTIPEGTAFIRIRLLATRSSGATTDAFFDQVTLRALGQGAARLPSAATDDGLPVGSALTVHWDKTFGPGNVQIADPVGASTTATFDALGAYALKLSATDSFFTVSTTASVLILEGNKAPVVEAGANQSIMLPSTATLSGTVSDDALPGNATLTTGWSVVSGPGTVTFSAPNALQTPASFSAPGVYILRLTANDTQYTMANDVSIAVSGTVPINQGPVVSAGMNQAISLPYDSLTLNGSASDDNLPSGSHLIVSWSQVSGPGQATFSVPNAVRTQVSLPAVGSYVFQLTASDGELSTSATVSVTLNPQHPANQAPVVNAGATQSITLPANSVTLNGSVQDDGQPPGATLLTTWSQVSGPGTVTFSAPNQAVTDATFSAAGVYALQLSAFDSEFTVTSTVTIRVNQAGGGSGVTVHLDSLADGAVITSPTPIVATISGGAWTLEYSLDADEELTSRS
jgi:PKD repeat protein